ncbi:MAG: glycerol-3-phosphate 1-O-acyltransferase PlsY [bacterium]|jgi:glycerol-3-phosphate acyltransferase PlsY|nr:glycerol-3-phosphate 1-O-acyltransferase PlsY [bacterium]
MNHFAAILIAYVLGSIPSAYYAGRWIKGIDLRTCGSGNLGFTNAWRTLGAKWSIPVLLFDIGKGVAAVLLAFWLAPGSDGTAILAGLVAILGHNWTIFLGFKGGGKGVACSAGVFLTLMPYPFLITFVLFLLILTTTRYMSLASIVGALALVCSGTVFRWLQWGTAPSTAIYLFSIFAALLIILKHLSNIKRLLQGTEPKLGHHSTEEKS